MSGNHSVHVNITAHCIDLNATENFHSVQMHTEIQTFDR